MKIKISHKFFFSFIRLSLLEPRCSRLMICTKCSPCSQRKEYNPAPYGEPGLLWPWNIKRNRHSGAFFEDDATMKDELLPAIMPPIDPYQSSRPASIANQIELMKYRDGTTAVMYNNHSAVAENGNTGPRTQPRLVKNTNNQPQQQQRTFDFEPVVLFNPPDKMTPITPSYNSTPNNHHRAKSKPPAVPQVNHNPNLHQQNRRKSTEPVTREPPQMTQPYQWISSANHVESDARDSGSGRYDSTPSIIEKYFQSQEPYAQQQKQQSNTNQQVFSNDNYNNPSLGNRNGLDHINNRDSMLTEDESVDLHELDSQLESPPQPNNNKRSPPRYTELHNREPPDNTVADNGENKDELNIQNKPSPPNYRDIISSLSDYSDAPRALFRKDSNGADQPVSSRRAKRNRKSLDSLLLKTLEDIEEQAILNNSNPATANNNNNANSGAVNTPALERHVAIVRDALQKATRSFDSVSSTCSSSVGELRRAFEFGKKYGLQQYGEIPDYLQESMDDLTVADDDDDVNAFHDFLDQEKLLDLMSLTNFSEQPKSLNDIEVKMPLPVRLNDSSDEDNSDAESGDDFIPDISTTRGNNNRTQHQTLSLV